MRKGIPTRLIVVCWGRLVPKGEVENDLAGDQVVAKTVPGLVNAMPDRRAQQEPARTRVQALLDTRARDFGTVQRDEFVQVARCQWGAGHGEVGGQGRA